MRLLPALAAAMISAAVAAQVDEQFTTTHALGIDSGLVANPSTSPATMGVPQVVWSTVVTVPGSAWLRLEYDGVLLSGSPNPGGDGSFVRLTSLLDGAVQTQHLVHVGQWRDTSAYFNGDSVLVELVAHQGTGESRLVLRDAIAAPLVPVGTDSICGNTDDRVLDNNPRVARMQPTGCTVWMINDCGHCFLTAGHCIGSGSQIVEFNVPLSTSSGSLQHPPPSDQYTIDQSSMQDNGGQGTGNDWAYFGVFDNSVTGLTPYEANGGLAFTLIPPPSVSGQIIRVTGNGSTSSPVSPTWYLVPKTHAGPYVSFSGTTVRYATDTTGGNSGSPVFLDGTDLAIAIHTHGGCSPTGGSNIGTGTNHSGLQAALASPQGVCDCPAMEFAFPSGQPNAIDPDGSTTLQFTLTSSVGVVPGSVALRWSDGGAFATVTATSLGNGDYSATFPTTTCGTSVVYYLTAQGQNGTTYTSPANAPNAGYHAPVGETALSLRRYDFESAPPGWTVNNTAVTAGAWVRGTPGVAGGPAADFDGSGQCWVTGNSAGEDVDGGPTRLVSETLTLTSVAHPFVSYAVWFSSNNDQLQVEVSNDAGGTWVTQASIGNTAGWQVRTIDVRSIFPSPGQFRMRWSVADSPNDGTTEAAIDAFRLDNVYCTVASWNPIGTGCSSGTSNPQLTALNVPSLGSTFITRVNGLGFGIPAMLVSTTPVLAPLPFPEFASGCFLFVQPDVLTVLTPSSGLALYFLPIPNNLALDGVRVYQQAIEFGAPWTMTAAGYAEIH
ncbi:MAG: hypothetical protein R3F29_13870 [Planctomycetota bacterium]